MVNPMNLHNLAFRTDPTRYVRQRAINGVAWFMRNQGVQANQYQNLYLNMAKEGSFDLQGDGQARQVILTPVGNVTHHDQPISAYWCPFIQGNGLPGFVDIPTYRPRHRFVFTAAMNGCALMVTSSPLGPGMIRVYHHQHPGDLGINQLILQQGQEVLSFISFGDYGSINQQVPAPNAFNFLYYRNSGWRYVLQPQTFNMMTLDVALNPAIPPRVLDV